jgi:hypothetical protein
MGAYTDFLPHHSLMPEVMRHDVLPHALRLVTIWIWDTHAVGSLIEKTVLEGRSQGPGPWEDWSAREELRPQEEVA